MNEEQYNLINKAKDSLRASKILLKDEFFAFSVSRTYYSMFYLAEAILLSENLSFSKHSAVISAFGHHFVRTGKVSAKFHRYLLDGQNLRNAADYDTAANISKSEAETEIEHAQEFINFVENYLSNSSPSS